MIIRRSLLVHRPPEQVYAFWRKLDNLAMVAPVEATATQLTARMSHWRARGPAGRVLEWDAEITEETPGREIAWASLPGSDVRNSGHVRFEPAAGEATQVHVEIDFEPPGGVFGQLVGGLASGVVERQVGAGLERARREIEIG